MKQTETSPDMVNNYYYYWIIEVHCINLNWLLGLHKFVNLLQVITIACLDMDRFMQRRNFGLKSDGVQFPVPPLSFPSLSSVLSQCCNTNLHK